MKVYKSRMARYHADKECIGLVAGVRDAKTGIVSKLFQ